jgi:hypothetical protein
MNTNKTVLSLHFRYIGAWREINTRIQLKQYILSAYISSCLTILGFVASTKDSTDYQLLYFLPILSLFFVFIFRMHEEMIENLYQFLRRAEFLDSMDERMAAPFPSYHWDAFHRSIAIRSRNINNIVIVVLIIAVHIIASFMVWKRINIFSSFDYSFIIASILIFSYTFWIIYKFKFIWYKNVNLGSNDYPIIKDRQSSSLPDDKIWNTNENTSS